MTITVAWDNAEQTIILFGFNGLWNFDELFQATGVAHGMIEAQGQQNPVASILNIGTNNYTTGNVMAFMKRGITRKHERTKVVVVVTPSRFFEILLNTLLRVYPPVGKMYSQANTLDEGRELALKRLAELPTD